MAGSFCSSSIVVVADTVKVVVEEAVERARKVKAIWRRRCVQLAQLHATRAQSVLLRSVIDADGADDVRERGRPRENF